MSEEVVASAVPAVPVAPAAPAAPAAIGTPAPNPAESAPAPKGDETKPDTPDQAEKRGQSRFERKISRLHREAAEARAESNLLRRQLEEAKPKPQTDSGAPRLENFKDIEEYAQAVSKHAADKALKSDQEKRRSETQQQYQSRLSDGWESKVSRADGKYEDFDEVVGEIKPNSPWAMAVMEAENGEDIAYYLGKNLKEAHRIAALNPFSQAREIGRLEAKLLATPPQAKQPSKAPAPIAPLSGTAPAEVSSISDTKDIGKWIKARQKQVHGARR